MNEVIGRILKSRITREKANNTLNVEEMTNTLNIFLAGGSITAEQYAEFTDLIAPAAASTTNATEVNTSTESTTTTDTTKTA